MGIFTPGEIKDPTPNFGVGSLGKSSRGITAGVLVYTDLRVFVDVMAM